MPHTTLIDADEAIAHLQELDWVFIDCRFVLGAPQEGREVYLQDHIAGAVYAHLEEDLSSPVERGRAGRHHLPGHADFNATMSRLGVDGQTQVVAYDTSTGAMAAARLWWLLKWAGHDAVAVLNGGYTMWRAKGYPTASGAHQPHQRPTHFRGNYQSDLLMSTDEVLASLPSGEVCLVDARSRDRYRGENETIDPIAGHIPGAVSLPYLDNVRSDGLFLEPQALRARFAALAQRARAQATVFYCGSGVTAAHNILAFARAGLGTPKLYAGSWSEWIVDPTRPIATGEE